ncbi:hypothetical protein DFH09DRAFT_121802 [Mycena vulgaris]|nr:hypothetical protein DFH09DRAFT_121802 [Mycena vulgaris]
MSATCNPRPMHEQRFPTILLVIGRLVVGDGCGFGHAQPPRHPPRAAHRPLRVHLPARPPRAQLARRFAVLVVLAPSLCVIGIGIRARVYGLGKAAHAGRGSRHRTPVHSAHTSIAPARSASASFLGRGRGGIAETGRKRARERDVAGASAVPRNLWLGYARGEGGVGGRGGFRLEGSASAGAGGERRWEQGGRERERIHRLHIARERVGEGVQRGEGGGGRMREGPCHSRTLLRARRR